MVKFKFLISASAANIVVSAIFYMNEAINQFYSTTSTNLCSTLLIMDVYTHWP